MFAVYTVESEWHHVRDECCGVSHAGWVVKADSHTYRFAGQKY
jgi:hypothetical protein